MLIRFTAVGQKHAECQKKVSYSSNFELSMPFRMFTHFNTGFICLTFD